VVRFARYLRAEDLQHEIPPADLFYVKRHRPVPYIFSNEEIKLLVSEACRIGPEGSLRPYTYSTLFALLAVTGMRISEALSLRLNDFTKDGLIVRKTKFQKSRLIPLHKTTMTAIQDYLKRRSRVAGNDDHLFVSQSCRRLTYACAVKMFRRVCDSAGLPLQQKSKQLRYHDLRHSFAVKVLEACPGTRKSITRNMLALSTYMGHGSIRSNYWYLESTPRLLADVATDCEALMKGDPS
jgi:integrase